MSQWYYARNDQQQGPVSWDHLRDLAAAGKLARNDMVWQEGMPDWKKAGGVDGLFAEAAPVSRGRRVADDEDLSDRPRRKKKKKQAGMSPAALAGIIGGSLAALLVIIIVVVVLVVRTGNRQQPGPVAMAPQPVGGAAAAGAQTYSLNLGEGQENHRAFQFQQGQQVTLTVSTRGGFLEDPDVDLIVTRAGDRGFLLIDDSFSKDCFINFVAPATDQYTLAVHNLGPGVAACTVSVR